MNETEGELTFSWSSPANGGRSIINDMIVNKFPRAMTAVGEHGQTEKCFKKSFKLKENNFNCI